MDHPTFHARRVWFASYREDVLAERREAPAYLPLLPCPCCGYPTLHERAIWEVCELCWWEDDGYDDGGPWGRPGDLDRKSGPNHMTLREARENFEELRGFRGEKPIPLPIWDGENDHTLPYPGDNGIRFELTEGLRGRRRR